MREPTVSKRSDGSPLHPCTHFGTLRDVIVEKRLPAQFYRTIGGAEPVRDLL